MNLAYLVVLLGSLGCMVLLDKKFTLFFWRAPIRAALVLGAGVVFFVVWDLLGIGLEIFQRGETSFMSGILLAPEFPLEELFFLTFLCYLTMVLLFGSERLLVWLRGVSVERRSTR